MVNLSLESGIVPDSFKEACVIPLHKGGSKKHDDMSAYRPVSIGSILSCQSKVLKAMVAKQLKEYLAENELIPDTQHGFRRGRSTFTSTASVHAEWKKAVA
jgi:hypothetical protein